MLIAENGNGRNPTHSGHPPSWSNFLKSRQYRQPASMGPHLQDWQRTGHSRNLKKVRRNARTNKYLLILHRRTGGSVDFKLAFNDDGNREESEAVPHSEVSAYIQLADIEMHWFDPRHPHRTIGPSGMEVSTLTSCPKCKRSSASS